MNTVKCFPACIVIFLSCTVSMTAQTSLLGFKETAISQQLELEKTFEESIDRTNIDQWVKRLSARPHHVGSPYGKENAEFIAEQFRSWGYDVSIEEFQVLVPFPKLRELELVSPTKYKAGLTEPSLNEDATSGQTDEQLPTFNCYSADGDLTAKLVFANYGLPSDYEELAKMGIDVKGKIVITKYGRSWRGIKPKVAAEKGAIGCIIYSDPADDGYFRGDVYPDGPFKNEYGVQRGSVLDMPKYPGDPLTPNRGATTEAERLSLEEAPTLMQIPVLPISYQDALPFLAALGGPVAPRDFRGALPITYHVGPGPAKVHLRLEFDWSLRTAYNVIARLEGSSFPDQWVLRGNHHDAWVNGAADPVSGIATLMEEARVVAELSKSGNRSKRTIIYCAWDAEEPGLLGSTEWVEQHAGELNRKAVVYINTDSNSRGFLFAGGSHTLERFFEEVTHAVTDPQTGLSVFKRRKAADQVIRGQAETPDFKLSALGSGSDYSPFLQHLGIASLNIGFGGEGTGGEYHSIYDSYDHYTRFKDPGFHYCKTLANVAGRTTLRLANADLLPFDFERFHKTVAGYTDEIMKLTEDMRKKTEKENKLIREGLYEAAADPTKTFVVPEPKEEVPFLNFAPLQNAVGRLEKSSKEYMEEVEEQLQEQKDLAALNQSLYLAERALTRPEGLPGRPWYKHYFYAPGFYTGYGVKTLPGVREAIEERDWTQAQEQIGITAEVLEDFSGKIDVTTTMLGGTER